MIEVREAVGPTDMDAVRRLVLAHADAHPTTPGVEQIRADAVRLPGPYVPPRGGIWIAADGDEIVGCVALQPLPAAVGEVKRLFVDPGWRGRGVGRALMERLIAVSRERGHAELRLATLPEMMEAQGLYRSLGFIPIESYRPKEPGHSLFFALDLGP